MLLKSWCRSILPALFLLALPALSGAQVSVGVSVNFPPPELPVYEQPPIPGEGYIWTPGYWAWGDDIQDYYWVPGTWVEAPEPMYLWTPGYWADDDDVFYWHPGYWGPHVGFYGGVNYGYGYGGEGYEGGYWRDGRLYYNRSVNNINNRNISNVYNRTVNNNVNVARVSYSGGNGVRARPSPADQEALRERHIPVTPMQGEHQQAARGNPVLRASENHGRPPIAATPRPAVLSGAGVVPATRGGAVSVSPGGTGDRRGTGGTRGTMSVVSPNAEPRAPQPENRPAQPENRQAQPQNRPATPEYRQPSPDYRQSAPQPRPVQPEYRPPQPQPRAAPPEAPRQPMIEQRRAPEQAPPPRQAAPPPPPPQRQQVPPAPPRAEPRPTERPGARDQDRERR